MSALLSICLSEILRALLIWIPILVGSVILIGVGIFVLSRHRFRYLASASPTPVPRWRVWTVRALLIITQVVFLPFFAFVTAIPFSLQWGAANTIESASPRIVDWGLRTGTHALREKLSIADNATVVDLGRLAPVLRTVAPAATRAQRFLNTLSGVPRLATSTYFRALTSAVDEAAAADLKVTWDDLFQSANRHFSALWAGQVRIVASLLRVSSLHFIYPLAVTTAIVDLLCVLVVGLLTRHGAAARSDADWSCMGKPHTGDDRPRP
jgi:hypothetical protein